MKYVIFSLCVVFSLQLTTALAQKKAPLHFSVKQDDDEKDLFVLDVPPAFTINTAPDYALYEQGKSSLTVNYELDDDPELTVRKAMTAKGLDLLKYSQEISADDLAGTSDVTISGKTVAAAIKTFNGFQTVKLTYDYKHVISGANVTETGKVVMYIIKVTGTSLINTDEHSFIVRLKFDYQQNSGDDLSKLDAQIMNTIKKGNDLIKSSHALMKLLPLVFLSLIGNKRNSFVSSNLSAFYIQTPTIPL